MNDITITSLLYPVMIIVCLVIIYSNEKKRRQYKKENIEILFLLNEDDKTMRLTSRLLLVFMILSSVAVLLDSIKRTGLYSIETITMIALPIMFVVLYVPLSRKTKITTLGIFKRLNLVRWEDIKGVDYIKPDIKGRQKVKILYKTSYRDMTLEIVFKKDDEQLNEFKKTVKEYRNKKKDKKSGREK